MMTPQQFDEMTARLARANGVSPEKAEQYAARIGDTPELAGDGSGRVVVRGDDGTEERVNLREAMP